MPSIYTLYLASSFVLPFMVSTIFFVTFLMTFELFRILQLMSSKDITFGFILGLMGDVAVTLVPMAVPLSIFFSTIFCLNKLSGDSEYIALRSFGLQKKNIFLPFVIIGAIMAMNLYFLNQDLVPNAHRNVRKKIKIISSTSLIEGIKTGQFFTNIPNVTLFPEIVNEETKVLTNVYLHIYNPKLKKEKIIHAASGKILHDKNQETGIETFNLLLMNGNIIDTDETNTNIEKILFEKYTFPISEQKFSYNPSTKEIMMNRQELVDFIDTDLVELEKKGFDKKDFFNAQYEYWNRFNTPLLVLLLTFLGFGLGVKGNRSRGKNSSGRGILILMGYYVIFFSLVSVAKDGAIPILVSMLIPALLLFGVSFKLYIGLDWQS
jgi:lipopolysaccharide export system permease protein